MNPRLKDFLYFLKRKPSLNFRKKKLQKKSLCFGKRNFFIFQEVTFHAPKIKRTHSGKIELSSPNVKKLLIFQDGTYNA